MAFRVYAVLIIAINLLLLVLNYVVSTSIFVTLSDEIAHLYAESDDVGSDCSTIYPDRKTSDELTTKKTK